MLSGNRTLMALMVGAALWSAAPARAQEAPPPDLPAPQIEDESPDMDELAMLDEMAAAPGPHGGGLGLSDDQKAKMRDIMTRHTREMIKLHGEEQLQRFDLRTALTSPSTDAATATRLQQAVSSTEAALAMERLHMMLDMKSILTPDQLKRFGGMWMMHHHGRGHGRSNWHGGWHGRGPGGPGHGPGGPGHGPGGGGDDGPDQD